MSTTNNEALYATCHDEAWEEYQRVYKLKDNEMLGEYVLAVSYTHLTLPTKRIV